MTPARRDWARGDGVRLRPIGLDDPLPDGVEQALRDGIERGFEGERPTFATGAQGYEIRADGIDEVVGLLVVRLGRPSLGAATFVAVAIAPAHRGHAFGMRALLAAEARLTRKGVERCFSVVPRTNGRGLYFMLRCGYAPLQRGPDGARAERKGCTWFARAPTPRGSG